MFVERRLAAAGGIASIAPTPKRQYPCYWDLQAFCRPAPYYPNGIVDISMEYGLTLMFMLVGAPCLRIEFGAHLVQQLGKATARLRAGAAHATMCVVHLELALVLLFDGKRCF